MMSKFQHDPPTSFRSANRKRAFFVPAVASLLVASLAAAASAQTDVTSKLVRDIPLLTKDGWRIAITYYESTAGKEAPVVVLLHSKGGSRLDWKTGAAGKAGKWTKGLAGRLHREAGFAVIAVDLRGHGQSRDPRGLGATKSKSKSKSKRRGGSELKASDYTRMVLMDMVAVKKFIKTEHQDEKLNMRKMAIIAADMSVPVAVNYALIDWTKKPYSDAPTLSARTPRGQDVRAMVFLSPVEKVPGVMTGPPLVKLRSRLWGISFLICKGERDPLDKGATKKVNQHLTAIAGNESRVFLREYPTKYRGTDLIGRRLGVETNIVNFLKLRLKNLPGVWRDRKSKLSD
jgi:pimeloyl-ACP methyl ester carboxylesterase